MRIYLLTLPPPPPHLIPLLYIITGGQEARTCGHQSALVTNRLHEGQEDDSDAQLLLSRIGFFFIKHLYTGPEYGATGQSKTPSCQSGRLMIKQCAMIQNNLQLGGSIQHIYISKNSYSWSDHKTKHTVGQTIR